MKFNRGFFLSEKSKNPHKCNSYAISLHECIKSLLFIKGI